MSERRRWVVENSQKPWLLDIDAATDDEDLAWLKSVLLKPGSSLSLILTGPGYLRFSVDPAPTPRFPDPLDQARWVGVT